MKGKELKGRISKAPKVSLPRSRKPGMQAQPPAALWVPRDLAGASLWLVPCRALAGEGETLLELLVILSWDLILLILSKGRIRTRKDFIFFRDSGS